MAVAPQQQNAMQFGSIHHPVGIFPSSGMWIPSNQTFNVCWQDTTSNATYCSASSALSTT